ncbi:MAG: FHA domain-containing protein [Deltaproteobacteria bacterium]|nr:FHA domain-containing protein [Deltaproteobacteria bacterium]
MEEFSKLPKSPKSPKSPTSEDMQNPGEGTRIVQRNFVPRLQMMEGSLVQQEIDLAGKADFSLGRSDECDLKLRDFKTSRIHAIIQKKERSFVIEDQGSRNGTYVNGTRIQGPTALESGALIQIGDSHIRFLLVDPDMPNVKEEKFSIPQSPPQSPMDSPASVNPMMELTTLSFEKTTRLTTLLSNRRVKLWGGTLLAIFLLIGITYWPSSKEKQVAHHSANDSAPSAKHEEEIQLDQLFQQALRYYREERYGEAMREAGRILQVDPGHEGARDIFMASEQAQMTQQEKAELFKREREAKELADQVAFYYSLGVEHFNKSSVNAAIENFEKVLEIDPSHEEARQKLAAAASSASTVTAGARLEPGTRSNGTHSNTRDLVWVKQKNALARKHYDQGEYDKAIAAWKSILWSKKKFPAAQVTVAKKGLESARNALLNKYSAEITQAEVLYDAGEYAKARTLLSPLAAEDSSHPKLLSLLRQIDEQINAEVKRTYIDAVVDENVGEVERAKSKFRQIASIAPKENLYYKKAVEKLRKLR